MTFSFGSARRYAIVGAANTVLYSVLLYFFLKVVTLGGSIAVTLSYTIAVPFHFLMNRAYVFRASDRGLSPQMARYGVSVAISYVVSLVVVFIGLNMLQLEPLIVVAMNLLATMVAGFMLSALWVFK